MALLYAAEFLEHATQEMQHADSRAKRNVELGGEPNFSPDGLSERSHAEYIEGSSLQDMIKENLIAERIAVESYRGMIGIFNAQRFHDTKIARGYFGCRGRARGRLVVAIGWYGRFIALKKYQLLDARIGFL